MITSKVPDIGMDGYIYISLLCVDCLFGYILTKFCTFENCNNGEYPTSRGNSFHFWIVLH